MTISNYLQLIRIKQVHKNLLVYLSAIASGFFYSYKTIFDTTISFLAFCFASFAIYIFNDIQDLEFDKRHPIKQHRILASGLISKTLAMNLFLFNLLISLSLSLAINFQIFVIIFVYTLINIAYSLKLKELPILDLFIVSSGFVLRGLAGVAAVSTRPTTWFFLLSLFGSLTLVSGKRLSDSSISMHQKFSQVTYSKKLLAQIQMVSISGLILSYVLMVQDREDSFQTAASSILLQFSSLPIIYGAFYYLYLSERDGVDDPSSLFIKNRVVVLLSVIWFVSFSLAIYFGR